MAPRLQDVAVAVGGSAYGLLAEVVEQFDTAFGGDGVVGDVDSGVVGRGSQLGTARSDDPHTLDIEGSESVRELGAGLVGGVGLD